MKRLALLLAALWLALPSSALAWKFVCDTYQVVQCDDGTTIGCSSGGQQFDCPDNEASVAAYENFCADHGGYIGLVDEPICVAPRIDVKGVDDLADPEDHSVPVRRR